MGREKAACELLGITYPPPSRLKATVQLVMERLRVMEEGKLAPVPAKDILQLKVGDKVVDPDNPLAVGTVRRFGDTGNVIIEFVVAPCREFPYGARNSESWKSADWQLLKPARGWAKDSSGALAPVPVKDAIYPKTEFQKPGVCKLCGRHTRILLNTRKGDVYDWHSTPAGKNSTAGGKPVDKVNAKDSSGALTIAARLHRALDAALTMSEAKDVQLRPNVDGACRLDYGDDGARSAFKKWALNKNGKAKDVLAPVPVKDAQVQGGSLSYGPYRDMFRALPAGLTSGPIGETARERWFKSEKEARAWLASARAKEEGRWAPVPVKDAQTVIETYKGFDIERGDTNAIRVVDHGRRYAQHFNAWTEREAIEKAKRAIDREVAKPAPGPVKPEDLIISLNDLPKRRVKDSSGKWTGGGSDWSYWLDGPKCASAWMANGVWYGMGDGGTRKKFKSLEEAKKYAESVAPANLARIRREMGSGVRARDSSGALTVAALLGALWAWYHRQPDGVGPQDYDLNTYRPKRREW